MAEMSQDNARKTIDVFGGESDGLNSLLASNSDGPSAPSEKKAKSNNPANWTGELGQTVDKSLDKFQSLEKQRESTLLPTPPELKVAPKQENYSTSPMEKFGSTGMMIAALGSLFTRKHLTNALNSGAEVNKAINEGDESRFKTAFETWKIDNENAWKMADWQQKNYNNILAKIDAGEKGAEEELLLASKKFQDPTLEHAIQVGDYRKLLQTMSSNSFDLKEKAAKAEMFSGYRNQGVSDYIAANGGKKPDGAALADIDKKAIEQMTTGDADYIKKEESSLAKTRVEEAGKIAAAQPGATPDSIAAAKQTVLGESKTKTGGKVAGAATINQDSLDEMTDEYLGGNKAVISGLGYGNAGAANRLALRENIARVMKERGMSGHDVDVAMAEYQGLVSGERTVAQRGANTSMFSNEAKNMAGILRKVSGELRRSSFVPLANGEIMVDVSTNDPKADRYNAAINTYINAYAKAVNGGGQALLADKEHARVVIFKGMDDKALNATLDILDQEMDSAIAAPGQTKDELAGRSVKNPIRGKGYSKESPLPAPADNKYEIEKYYDLGEKGRGIHKYLGNGSFED